MKKIFRNMLLMAGAAALALNFASCKGDGEDDNKNEEEAVLFTDGDVQYKMSLSELKDADNQLSFTQIIEYIKPIDLKEEITFTFKYNSGSEAAPADSVAPADSSASQPVVEKKDYPIIDASMVINCGSEANAQMVRDSMLTDTVSYDIAVEGSKVVCTYKQEVIKYMTYASAETIYNELAKQLGDQRKKNDANKAKEESDAKKQEAENNRKTNYNFDRDSVGGIVSTDSTIGFTLVKSGVAAVYSYTFDKTTGMITSGSVVCVCKNSDVAKAYAKEHMKDKNAKGQLIYKSINLDGSNVIMVYSASAIEGLHKRDIVAAQQSGQEPDASSIGKEIEPEENNTEENNGGENNGENNGGENNGGESNEENNGNQQEENNNSQNTENESNENGNTQNPENGQNENNDDPVPQIIPEENSNIKPDENENNNNNEEPLPHEPIIDNGEGEVVAKGIVGKWESTSDRVVGEGISISVTAEELGVDYLDFASDGNFSNEWFTEEGEKVVDLGVYSINDDVLKIVWDDNEEVLYRFSLSGDTLIVYEYCFYVSETDTLYETYDSVPEHAESVRAEIQHVYKRI
ncbi:MAG: lipocalin family protein [Salinivirgaceae bacterium]|nr:lipocalin family protein [Salinivirgaceae bacterium]